MDSESLQHSSRRAALAACIAASVLTACASGKSAANTAPFDGDWTIRWCDKARPNAECGGFWLSLVQQGNQLCGTFGGARINFAQVDEGQGISVRGEVKGDTAELTIESGRNGAVYRAHATVSKDRMHWKLGDTLREPEYRDIDIIAIDDVLERNPGPHSLRYEEMSVACSSS